MTNFSSSISPGISRFFMYIAVFGLIGLSSCKKIEDNVKNGSYLRFINASPTVGTYIIYADDQRVSAAALPFGGTISYTQYVSGTHTIRYTTASSTTSLLTKQVSLTANLVHSAYLIDKGDKMDLLLVTDDASITSATKAFVKFINLSPDAPSLNLDVKGGANLIKDKTYKSASGFVQVDPKTYDFDIKDSATGAVKTSLTGIEFAAGRYYTIISRGMLNPGANDQSFSAQSIANL